MYFSFQIKVACTEKPPEMVAWSYQKKTEI